ncbi:MAG: response regulator [Hyphomicrobiaceae bacterium]|nr:response regulator [Hyphomicrobiaceae bacterium]
MLAAPLILVADDNEDNRAILVARLEAQGYRTVIARDGEEALAVATVEHPDVILLDVLMPKRDGLEVCRALKTDASMPFTPIILVTARTATSDVVTGLDAGADDYLTKPVEHAALLARVRAMLRIKELQDKVTAQAAELAAWNGALEARVERQVDEIARLDRMRRFLSPQVADLILKGGQERLLEPHRREVTVVFCDLRGFTAFAEMAEPEEVMSVLGDYHRALGGIIDAYEGTLERYAGDGLLVFFNDPVPCPNPTERAVRMAVAARDAVGRLTDGWARLGPALGLGIGIAQGYATLGRIGFDGRFDYAAIGPVTNLGARLCGEAKSGQILVSQRVATAIEDLAELVLIGTLDLKGFRNPVRTWAVERLRT